MKKSLFPLFLSLLAFFLVSCAAQRVNRADELFAGNWATDKGVVMRVGRLADGDLGAEIVSAPGFYTNDLGAGNVVVRNIHPYAGEFAGSFVMPGTERPVSVRIRFLNRNTLLFESRDKRVKGNKMLWRRVFLKDTPGAGNPSGVSAP